MRIRTKCHHYFPRMLSVGLILAAGLVVSASAPVRSDDGHPQKLEAAECGYSPYMPTARNYAELVTPADPVIGNFNAPVTVVEYFDPNCSHCKALHPIMGELIARYGDHARFFMIPFPLWPYSFLQVEALYVAAARGKYYEMLDAQYDVQRSGGLSMEDIRAIAARLDIDPDWMQARIEEGRHLDDVMNRHKALRELGVRATPTIMINGRFVTEPESKTVSCLGRLIEEALSAAN